MLVLYGTVWEGFQRQSAVAAQEFAARTARGLTPIVERANDQLTADLVTQRLDVLDKTAWMLRSPLKN